MSFEITRKTPCINARRCGAKNKRNGLACKAMAIRGKARCRLHGGKSTGPRTQEGLERLRQAHWKHGNRSAKAISEAKSLRQLINKFDALMQEVNNHACNQEDGKL